MVKDIQHLNPLKTPSSGSGSCIPTGQESAWQSRFKERLYMGCYMLGASKDTELYNIEWPREDRDRYLELHTDKIVAEIEISGKISSIKKVEEDGELRTIFVRNLHDNIFLSNEGATVEGVTRDSSDNDIMFSLVDYVYDQCRGLVKGEGTPENYQVSIDRFFEGKTADTFFQQLIDLNSYKDRFDIIPQRTDLTGFFRMSEGCLRVCTPQEDPHSYCMWKRGGVPYPFPQIVNNIDMLFDYLQNYYRGIFFFDDIIPVSSDFAMFMNPSYTDFDCVKVIDYTKQKFPKSKISTFVHFGTLLDLISSMGRKGVQDKIKQLSEAGLHSVIGGYEAANFELSTKFGKPYSSKAKEFVINLFQNNGVHFKAVAQIGYGKGFRSSNGQYVSAMTALEQMIRSMNRSKPYRVDPVVLFEHEGFDATEWRRSNGIDPYEDPESGIAMEKDFIDNNMHLNPDVGFVTSSRSSRQVIYPSKVEYGYEESLPGYVAPEIKANFKKVFDPYKNRLAT